MPQVNEISWLYIYVLTLTFLFLSVMKVSFSNYKNYSSSISNNPMNHLILI